MIRPRVAALAFALVLAALAATATRAGGEAPAPAFPPSLPLRTSSGAIACRATPMGTGAYFAAHCRRAGALHIDGLPPFAWSVDPTRDLAHAATAASPGVVMRRAVEGEPLYWRNDRAAGSVTATAHGWQVADPKNANHYDYLYDNSRGGQPVILTHWRGGSRFLSGDSGTGAWSEDGALVGVLVSACTDWGCASPQSAAFVAVP